MEIIFLVDFDRDTRERVTFASTMKNCRGSWQFLPVYCGVTAGKRRSVYERSRKTRCVYIRSYASTRVLYVYIAVRFCFAVSPSNGRATRRSFSIVKSSVRATLM